MPKQAKVFGYFDFKTNLFESASMGMIENILIKTVCKRDFKGLELYYKVSAECNTVHLKAH